MAARRIINQLIKAISNQDSEYILNNLDFLHLLVTEYCNRIVKGKIVACKKVIQSCQRHLNDLKKSKKKGYSYYFNPNFANTALAFYPLFCKHTKGSLAGKPIILELWQIFIIGSQFGWVKKKDDLRRFKLTYVQVARKNGKSTISSGIALEGMSIFSDEGGEIYSAGVKRDQAKIVWNDAVQMINKSGPLRDIFKVRKSSNLVECEETYSKYEPLGADADTLDGLNVYIAILDELHAHKSREMYDVLETAIGARKEPFLFCITTAGFNLNGVCYELYNYSEKVLDGVIEADTIFIYIAELDKEDDWTKEKNWIKANPNLGVSCSLEDLKEKCKKAQLTPAARTNFLTKHMNIWVNAAESWIDIRKWNETDKDLPNLSKKLAWGGVDLSATTDLTAICLEFPLEDGEFAAIWHYFIPEDKAEEKEKVDRVPYRQWAKDGYVTITHGSVVDYDAITQWFLKMSEEYEIKEIGYDPYNSTQWAISMQALGFSMIPVRQGYLTLSPPTKDTEKLIVSHKLIHGNNPITTWCLSNCVTRKDPAGNIKLDKEKAQNKIDGMVAFICAHSRCMLWQFNNSDLAVWSFN